MRPSGRVTRFRHMHLHQAALHTMPTQPTRAHSMSLNNALPCLTLHSTHAACSSRHPRNRQESAIATSCHHEGSPLGTVVELEAWCGEPPFAASVSVGSVSLASKINQSFFTYD
ncbi:hypothetical protein E2C01_003696 [Portunus trituberculatus]|uniref:Uncharacterized protein n=1 Tax=Portunus trituberculatus TaxID=210409 RepID=A0A5B7CQV0_PORTR|nr:hypothetical protein [Portunus trituberculatus]